MFELLCLFRALNLHAHHMHNITKGDEFFQDHAFFAELYEFADDAYDSVIERLIGTKSDEVDLCSILGQSHDILMSVGDEYLKNSLIMVEEGAKLIDQMAKDDTLSSGTQNMLQGLSDQMEVFIYKLKRRMK